jgi:hypothetical protein
MSTVVIELKPNLALSSLVDGCHCDYITKLKKEVTKGHEDVVS